MKDLADSVRTGNCKQKSLRGGSVKASHAVPLCGMEQREVVLKKLTKLIVLGEPMPRDILHKVNTLLNLSIMQERMLTKLPNPCLASTLIRVLVFTKNHTRLKVLYTNISVLPALHLKVKLTHIQRLTVEISSIKIKKSMFGHVP